MDKTACEMCGRNEPELLTCQLCSAQLQFKCSLNNCVEHEVIIYGNCTDCSTWICNNCRLNKENQQENKLRELKHFNTNQENLKRSRRNRIRELMMDRMKKQQQENNDERRDSASSDSYQSCEEDNEAFYNCNENVDDLQNNDC